nr:immunoglobulin heavy chain junction region [Mus musculus]MBK4187396.1 immunoglobulin heavy chain junction region [Mus musculus]MBK4187398.1 immunoglobulin heavy chain junction region [Mus musculus]
CARWGDPYWYFDVW